jgi:hypothetical protein
MPALARPTIADPGREQVSLEEPVADHKIVGVRQAAFRIKEDKMQFVSSHRLVVPLNNINRLRLPVPIQRINLLQRIPGGASRRTLMVDRLVFVTR